jgi:hypothetical protein
MAEVELQVSRSAKVRHFVEITSPGYVEWDVSSVGFDISAEVLWYPGAAPAEAESGAREGYRAQPAIRVEQDSSAYACTSTGTIEFIFDNSYSVMRGKQVKLKLKKGPLPAADAIDVSQIPLPLPLASAAVPYDIEAANASAMKGVELFFTNNFPASEAYFAREKSRIPIFALSW